MTRPPPLADLCFCVVAGFLAVWSDSIGASEQEALNAFIESVESAERGRVCARRVTGFEPEFEAAFGVWKSKNAAQD